MTSNPSELMAKACHSMATLCHKLANLCHTMAKSCHIFWQPEPFRRWSRGVLRVEIQELKFVLLSSSTCHLLF